MSTPPPSIGTSSRDEPDFNLRLLASWFVPALIVAAIVGLAFLTLNFAGVFPVAATEAGEKTLAAALVLIGTLVTASVSLIGLSIKSSIDARTRAFNEREAERNHTLAAESERRNRVDTVIRAIQLLGQDGKDATIHQISGALLALDSLGEYDFAVALAGHLWPRGAVSRNAVNRVVRHAFSAGSADTQYAVARLLLDNAEKLPAGDLFLLWPLVDFGWPERAEIRCRLALAMAAAQALMAELHHDGRVVPGVAAVLFEALRDGEPQVQNLASSALRPFLDAAPTEEWLHTGTKTITIEQMRKALPTDTPQSNLAIHYATEVAKLVAARSTKRSS